VLSAIKHDASWSFSEFLFHVFRDKDCHGQTIEREQSHGNTVQAFLSGRSQHSPGEILDIWWHHRDGRFDRDSELMYSTSTPFSEIKPVRPALSSFAVQKVKDKLVLEAKDAVLPSSGLHATTSDNSTRRANWVDIGATTIPEVAAVFNRKQPITWHLLRSIAEAKPRTRQGVTAIRQNRPIDGVSVPCHHTSSDLTD
jgi:hypothetical protein